MGYINKQESVEKVVDAIRHVLRGEIYLSQRMTNHVLSRLGRGESVQQDPITSLTDRELEVFDMIGQGTTTQQIARKLGLRAPKRSKHIAKRSKQNSISATPPNSAVVQYNGCWNRDDLAP